MRKARIHTLNKIKHVKGVLHWAFAGFLSIRRFPQRPNVSMLTLFEENRGAEVRRMLITPRSLKKGMDAIAIGANSSIFLQATGPLQIKRTALHGARSRRSDGAGYWHFTRLNR